MLEKFLNKKVIIMISKYAASDFIEKKGIVTELNDDFIELDNDEIIAIKYITSIKSL